MLLTMLPELVIVQPPLANVFAALAARPLWLVEFNTMSGVAFTPVPAVLALEVLDALEDLVLDEDFAAELEDAEVLGAADDSDLDDAALTGVVTDACAD
jgi:hypothetical protein